MNSRPDRAWKLLKSGKRLDLLEADTVSDCLGQTRILREVAAYAKFKA